MSKENVETVRRLVVAFNEGGLNSNAVLAFFDEDAIFEEPPEQPGATVARGRDAVKRLFSRFDETWEEHRSEPSEIRAVDGERVLMLSVERFRSRDGLEVSQPCGQIFTVRAGKVLRWQAFWEPANAFEALGLRT